MAISESSRLKSSLEKEGVPVKRLIINQVLPASNSDCKFCAMKRKVCIFALRVCRISFSFGAMRAKELFFSFYLLSSY